MPVTDPTEELSGTEATVRDAAHQFAQGVLRPVGAKLDALRPEEVVAPDSILWDLFKQYRELGFNTLEGGEGEGSPLEAARIGAIVSEEMGWGDSGLSVSLGVAGMPALLARMFGRTDLTERFTLDQIGCWAVTEPDHGSDMVDFSGGSRARGTDPGRANCVARREGDEIVITGQKAAWVSNGTIAETAALFCAYEGPDGERGGGVFLVPLTGDGVSRGKPLDKIGQRPLDQGEIFFDGVRIPADHMLVGPDLYNLTIDGVLTLANTSMGSTFVGVARAALEHAVAYAKERVQGGVPIFEHQSVKERLFHMFRKVEAARALNRMVIGYNAAHPMQPRLELAIASKVTSTETAFEVASAAVQILGGNGLTREYPVEKLLRDARASMIEDGCNHVLSLTGADRL
jgi:alkylation response protein AidB-like acyl-CoA dehydrogenase